MKSGKRLFSCLIVAIMMMGALFCYSGIAIDKQIAKAGSEVSSYEALVAALEDADENSEIVVTQTIEVPHGATLDGHGATVRVSRPYIDEDGIVRNEEYSEYSVFTISGYGTPITIKNMTILGGHTTNAAVYNHNGTLNMENVTITRSFRGLYNFYGKTILKNCNVVRNFCGNAGGIFCFGGTLIMDGCSLSENYSTNSAGGGGAIEIKGGGLFYANNTVIINNSSSEIGGAINCYESKIYLANCTISGNVTTAANAYYGGGVGLNADVGGGAFYAVNTIITDNYQIVNDVKIRSDVGLYTITPNNFINCVLGEFAKRDAACPDDIENYINTSNCQIDTTSTFATKYRNDGVLIRDDKITIDFLHPAAITKNAGTPALYVPVKADKSASSGGVKTYFDYSDLNIVKMGYGEIGSITGLGDLSAPDAEKQVTTYYEGGERANGVIGASLVTNAKYYTVTLAKGFANGSITGATVYGDTYAEGTEITVQGNADNDYVLEYWVCLNKDMQSNTNSTKIATSNPYTFNVSEDVILIPIFMEQAAPEPEPEPIPEQKQNLPTWVFIVLIVMGVIMISLSVALILEVAKKKHEENKAKNY